MKKKILLALLLLLLSFNAVAQEDQAEPDESSGIFSSLPEVEINSVDRNVNSTGEASNGQTSFFWIIFLGLMLVGVVIYSFEVDPVWVVGFVIVSAVILAQVRTGFLPI